MDELGAEVSLKIRSAIKAKLVELGAYVDDELPDYIMVMVANKRSKIQMENDLNLFLGNNTINFTSWLHTVLVKLQEVTIANSQKKMLPAAEPAGVEKVAKVSKSLTVENETHKHSSKHKKKSKKSLDSKKRSSVSKKSERSSLDHLKSVDSVENSKADGSKIKSADSCKGKESKKKDTHVKSSSKLELTKSLALLDSKLESLEARSRAQRDSIPNEIDLTEDSITLVSSESSLLRELRGSEDKSEALTAATKVVSELVAPANPRKITLMQSDDEDFEDVINIRDAEMSEFLDAELDEGTPKGLIKKLAADREKSSPVVQPTLSREQMDVDDLEEQRAKLLRDIELLGKIKAERLSRNAADKYSVDSSAKSVVNRSGRLDIEPRLKLIDPDEFNIGGPPAISEVSKLKLSDRLGKRPDANTDRSSSKTPAESSLPMNKPLSSGEGRRVVSMTASRDVLTNDVPKRSIKDRLGEKKVVDASDETTFKNPVQVTRKIDPNILNKLIESKNLREQKLLGLEKRGHEDAIESPPKLSLSDRLGKKRELDERTVSSSSDRSRKTLEERETFKTRFMDRLGKRVAPSPSEEDVQARKRSTRIKMEDDSHSSGKRMTAPDAEQDDVDEPPRKRSVLSRVVAVSRESEDEDADTGVAVASVVRVQPRPKIPTALQPNKNLLLKAMADAQKSVAAAPVRQEVKLPPGQLFTRKYRDGPSNPSQLRDEVRSSRNPSLSLVHKYRDIGPTKMNITLEIPLEERQRTTQLSKSLQQRLNNPTIKVESLDAAVECVAMTEEIDEDIKEETEPGVEGNVSNKTSDEDHEVLEEYFGDEDDGLYETSAHASVNNSSIGYVSPIGEERNNDEAIYIPSKIRYNIDGEEEAELNEEAYTPRSVRPSGSGGEADTKFVVTMDGLDPAVYNPRKRTVEHQQMAQERPASPLPVMENERIHSWLQSLDRAKEDEERNERAVSPVVYKKPRLAVSERLDTSAPIGKAAGPCKYWPACRQGDQCEFTHPPNSLCKVFPNCKFGEKCIYVHPKCKFDLSCTRRDCPYSHGSSNLGVAAAKAVTSSRIRGPQTICRFYPKCSNVNCSFLHPKPCRFGRACTKPDCVFFHGEVPSLEKLKWVKKSAQF